MKKIVASGELMLRLKSPERERLFQSPFLEASFGGGEANVAVSLSILGMNAAFVGALSRDAVGDAALRALRATASTSRASAAGASGRASTSSSPAPTNGPPRSSTIARGAPPPR